MWDELSDLVARLLVRFPYTSISGSLLVVLALSAGLHNVHFEHDIRRSFSPVASQTELETETFLEFYNLSVFPQRAFFVFRSIDGGDILRDSHLNEILRMDKEVKEVLSLEDENGERGCDPMCHLNRPFHAFLKERNSSSTEISFPVTRISSTPIFLGLHMHTVPSNVSSSIFASQSLMADRIVLWYFSRADTPKRMADYKKITERLFEISKNQSFSNLVNFTIFGDEIANKEMVRGALEATYLMTIGFVLLLIFVVVVVWHQSPLKMVPLLVTATILTPFLATLAAFGFLAWVGFPIYSMQCVTPFLVLGIGVDDAFILMHRWRARSAIRDRATRLRRVIVDVGPSITITSITNMIAFGVGFFTPTPQMSLFCLATSVALLLDYAFTYTVLAPVVFLCIEDEQYQSVASEKNTPSFLERYSSFLTSTKGRLSCLGVLTVLYAFCSVGVFSMKSTFEPAKGFPADSPLMASLIGIRPVFDTYFPVNVYVNSPPTISDPREYSNFLEMVTRLESVPGAYGRDRTLLFLTPYTEFDKKFWSLTSSIFFGESEYSPSLHNLGFWLKQIGLPPNVHYEPPKNGNGEGNLTSFAFSLLGKGQAEWATRAQFLSNVREILGKYKEFNATLFDVDSPVLSLILTVRNDLIGSIGVTVACMAIVCLLFVSSRIGVLIITFTITSICFCLVGFLGWWGADLDPVTQVDVLLATGFSVDYTAHVAYQFYRGRGSPKDRVLTSLDEMAAPMVQAGLSTFLCMLPLILVPTYAIVAFAKTVFIVVGIGLVHGLFVLPVLVTSFCPTQKAEPLSPKEMTSLGILEEKEEMEKDKNGNTEIANDLE